MIKIVIFILCFILLSLNPSFGNTSCKKSYNYLIAYECYKKLKNNYLALENLEDLKKTTGVEVHDFIEYKKILLLKDYDDIDKNIEEFKINYSNSKLIKKIQLIKAENLFNQKKGKELIQILKNIEKQYKLSLNDKLRIKYLKALNLYRDKEYKSAFKLIKNIGVRNTTFKSKEITSAISNYKIKHNFVLSKNEKIKRLGNLYKNGQYSLFMNEFEDKLSPKILINKALIKIKSNEPNIGLKILRKISQGEFTRTGSQSQDLEAIAESKYRIILFNLKTTKDNSLLATELNSILINYPNYTRTNEVGYLSARLFTIDKNYKEAIKVYNWLIKTKSKDYIDKSFYGLGFSEYMLGNYKNAIGYFASLKESNQSYYKQLGSYWTGKCFIKLGDKNLASTEFNKLIKENKIGFYPFMASKILKIKTIKNSPATKFKKTKLHQSDINLLSLSKEDIKLRREIETYIRNKINLSNYKSYLTELYNADEYNLAIKISYSYKSNNKFKFPKGYKNLVDKYSKKYGVDSNLVYALIREESLFDPKAKSWVGAKGLMQLMDYTANMLDKELKIKSSLFNPEDNINLGTYYIMKLMKRFDNNIPNVLAAYNGGPKNVELWRERFNSLEDDEFIESIPFKETNGYVKRVLRSYHYYKSRN